MKNELAYMFDYSNWLVWLFGSPVVILEILSLTIGKLQVNSF